MCIRLLAVAAAFCALVTSAAAQSPSADERAIRDLIARYDAGDRRSHAADIIFWTGDFKRPTIGSQQGDPIPPEARPSSPQETERIPGSRRRVTTPIRIEIAKSGDLAYEFSDSELNVDLKSGEREPANPASVLRVWKKEAGQWKIAAMFARPHFQD
jgi:hypothetical protein